MRKSLFGSALVLITFFLLLPGCKKDKVFTVKGRLLLSRSQPVPVSNYQLSLFQRGSGGAPIALGTSSSFAEGKTDINGYFQIRFKEGDGTFFGIPTRNQAAVSLSGNHESTLPNFQAYNFPYTDPAAGDPIFLYKKVDTLYIRLRAFAPLSATDSFTIYANTISGVVKRTKTGLTATAGTELLLDTITQAVFSRFDYATKTYFNDVTIYKGPNFMPLGRAVAQDSLSAQDERSITLRYSVF